MSGRSVGYLPDGVMTNSLMSLISARYLKSITRLDIIIMTIIQIFRYKLAPPPDRLVGLPGLLELLTRVATEQPCEDEIHGRSGTN